MKGGKKGREPKGSGGGRGAAVRSKPKKPTAAKAPADAPPRKGSRKRPGYGGTSSDGDE